MKLAPIRPGIVSANMHATSNIAQTKSGIFFGDIPGARNLAIVMIIVSATANSAIPALITLAAQTSACFPKSYLGPDSGGYWVQPVSGPLSKTNPAIQSEEPANK